MSDDQLCPRRAYEVRRYHTWPVIHVQTVGEHSAQVWRILRAIWPDAPAHLLDHCMTHDCGELIAGDLPYPTKANNSILREEIQMIENETHAAMTHVWSLPPSCKLTGFEHAVFKLAEYIEMWEYALTEILYGNHHASLIGERMCKAIGLLQDSELIKGTPQGKAAYAYGLQREAYFYTVKGS